METSGPFLSSSASKTDPNMRETNTFFERVFTVRKFLLVALIGMALAIYVYGVVDKYMVEEVKLIDHVEETTMMVYVE